MSVWQRLGHGSGQAVGWLAVLWSAYMGCLPAVAESAPAGGRGSGGRDGAALWSFGGNWNGQLGDGTWVPRSYPVPVLSAGVAGAAGGQGFTLIVKTDGSLWGCGGNGSGVLGDEEPDDRPEPFEILPAGVASVAAGSSYTLFVTTEGALWGCGLNSQGQLGNGTQTSPEAPIEILSSGVARVVAGQATTYILKTNGSLWGCGDNGSAQLGRVSPTRVLSPVEILPAGVASVAAGALHALVLTTNGALWACGKNSYGQLGTGDTDARTALVEVRSSGVAAAAAGSWHSVIVTTEGAVLACGSNWYGQVGDGTQEAPASWVEVVSGGVSAVAVSSNSTFARKTDGSLWAWGDNDTGQLGDGSTTNRWLPTRVISAGVTAVAAGQRHTLVLGTSELGPGLAVSGNGLDIANGDSTPATDDGTDFGLTPHRVPCSQVFTVTNAGTSAAVLGTPEVPAGFRLDEGLTSGLGPGGSDTFTVIFEAAVPGPHSGDVQVTTSDPAALLFRFAVTGLVGPDLPPAVTVEQASTQADPAAVSPVRFTVSFAEPVNGFGDAPGDVILGGTAGPTRWTWQDVAPLDGTTYEVAVFGMAQSGTVSASVPAGAATDGVNLSLASTSADHEVTYVLPADPEVAVSWGLCELTHGDATPVAAAGTDFGSTGGGVAVERTYAVTNAGGGTLTLGTVAVPAGFVLREGLTATLGPGLTDTFTVALDPQTPGVYAGDVSIPTSDADESPFRFAVAGRVEAGAALWVCGANGYGQLGDGTQVPRPALTRVLPWGVQAVAAGDYHSLVVKTDGSLWAWGSNGSGRLGDGTEADRPTPVQVLPSEVAGVAGGGAHTLILKTNGSVWVCGGNWCGQLGTGGLVPKSAPVQVVDSGAVAVAAGAIHSLVLKSGNAAYGWGDDWVGQLGLGVQATERPVTLLPAGAVAGLAAGRTHSLFVRTDGSLWACGHNLYGELGDGSWTMRRSPVQALAAGAAAVAGGEGFSLVRMTDGSVRACGRNDSGQLGDGTLGYRQTLAVAMAGGVAAIEAGNDHSLAVGTDGSLWAWGKNQDGQLGDGTTTARLRPFRVVSQGVVAVSAGVGHTLVAAYGDLRPGLVVTGNGQAIANGDDTPGAADGTQFGVVEVGRPLTHPFTLANPGLASLGLGAVEVPPGFEVAVQPAAVVAPGDQASLEVRLTATAAGVYGGQVRWTATAAEGGAFEFGVAGTVVPVAPSVTVEQAVGQADPAGAAPVLFTVVFRDPVTGFGDRADDVVLSGTAGAAYWTCREAARGDGTTYEVAVAGAPQSGTIVVTVPAGVAVDADGNANTASTSVDNQVTYAVPGEPDVAVIGGLQAIANGDSTPRVADGSDYGVAEVDVPLERTFTVINAGGGLLTVGEVSVPVGFRVVTQPTVPLGPGAAALFTVSLTAEATGVSAGAVTFATNDGDEDPFTFAVRGQVKPYGALWSCGANWLGQLGIGTTADQAFLTRVLTGGVVAAAVGGQHTLILCDDGSLWGCGGNAGGPLGDDHWASRPLPFRIVPEGVAAIAAGSGFSLFVGTDGSLWGCGSNGNGELGDGTGEDRSTPTQLLAEGVAAVTAGGYHSLVRMTDGSLLGSGYNELGQLGDGTAASRLSLVQVLPGGVAAVAAGTYSTFVVKTDHTLWACGDNQYGQLGDGTTESRLSLVPVMADVAAVAAGYQHTLILKTNGSLWACGGNDQGQLGDGTLVDRALPVEVLPGGVAAVAAGETHSLILKTDGSLWACGNNHNGRLGDGTAVNRAAPVCIAARGVVAAFAGPAQTLAVAASFLRREVVVEGNARRIACGDTTPAAEDGTDFGTAEVSTFIDHAFTVTNPGALAVQLGPPEVPAGFRVTEGLPAVLAPGAADSFTLRFEAPTVGASGGEVGIANNASDTSPFVFRVAAVTVDSPPGVTLDQAADQADPAVAAPVRFAVVFSEPVSGLGDDPADVTLGGTAAPGRWTVREVAPGDGTRYELAVSAMAQSGTVTAALPAGAARDRGGNPSQPSTSTDREVAFVLSAVAPAVAVSGWQRDIRRGAAAPSATDGTQFGFARVGTPVTQTYTVTNVGGGTLTLGPVTVPAGFTVLDDLAGPLAAGASESFTVRLDAVLAGSYAGDVQFATGDNQANPFAFRIAGEVQDSPTLWAWGTNSFGQLGDGSFSERPRPLPTLVGSVAAVDAGPEFTAILKTDGSLWVCGDPAALGYDEYGDEPVPTPVQLVSGGVAAIAAGGYHVLVLRTDHSLWAYGANYNGQLGGGDRATTVWEVMPDGVVSMAAGQRHSLAVKTDGSLWAWGANYSGQLGDGSLGERRAPVCILESGVARVGAGDDHTLIVKTDGSLWACGANYSGQLGDGAEDDRLQPVRILDSGVAGADGGSSHTVVLKTDGSLWACGSNGYGNLGDGTQEMRRTLVEVVSGGVATAAAGGYHTLIRMVDGSLWACGYRDAVGLGGTTDLLVPTRVMSRDVMQVAAGNMHSLAVVSGPVGPEIAVQAYGYDIGNGSTVPSEEQGTDFGDLLIGEVAQRTFTVTNTGALALTLGPPVLPAGYRLSEPLASELAPGAADTFCVVLQSQTPGAFAGSVSLATNDPDEDPFSFAVAGRVLPGALPIVTALVSPTPNGIYGAGDAITVTVGFSRPVSLVGGDLSLTLNLGRSVRVTPFADATSASVAFTVATGDDVAELDVVRLTLAPGATLRDASGNATGLALPAGQTLADNADLAIYGGWVFRIGLTQASSPDVCFGMHGRATDLWDPGLDVAAAAVPPSGNPLGGAFFYVQLAEWLGWSCQTELRGRSDAATWLLVVVANANAVTLDWDPLTVPAGHSLRLYQVDRWSGEPISGEALNMRITDQLVVPAGQTQAWAVEYGPPGHFGLDLLPGWNLISLPIQPEEPAVAAVFAAQDGRGTVHVGSVWRWVPAPSGGHYAVAATLSPLMGYWVYVESAVRVTVAGLATATHVTVSAGWNALGPAAASADPVGRPGLVGPTWCWDTAAGRYARLTGRGQLQPGHGYWVFARQAVTLDLGR